MDKGGGGFILNVRLKIVAQKLICKSSLTVTFGINRIIVLKQEDVVTGLQEAQPQIGLSLFLNLDENQAHVLIKLFL